MSASTPIAHGTIPAHVLGCFGRGGPLADAGCAACPPAAQGQFHYGLVSGLAPQTTYYYIYGDATAGFGFSQVRRPQQSHRRPEQRLTEPSCLPARHVEGRLFKKG